MVFEDTRREDCSVKKEKSMLDRLGIPVTHLDFKYVENCRDATQIEKILRILKSGEEGFYPEFQDYVQKRLETLHPKSRYLRVETPALRSDLLEKSERLEIENDLSDWLATSQKNETTKQIFNVDDTEPNNGFQDRPIRGSNGGALTYIETKKTTSGSGDGFLKPKNPDRIKSWDYDKWSKFNVEAELTKMEIEEMQREECKKMQVVANKNTSSKTGVHSEQVHALKGEDDKNTQFKLNSSKCSYTPGRLGRSFIEEISGDEDNTKIIPRKIQNSSVMESKKSQPKVSASPSIREQQPLIQEMPETSNPYKSGNDGNGKRVKIIIDDLRVG